jgi:hypothetical protein
MPFLVGLHTLGEGNRRDLFVKRVIGSKVAFAIAICIMVLICGALFVIGVVSDSSCDNSHGSCIAIGITMILDLMYIGFVGFFSLIAWGTSKQNGETFRAAFVLSALGAPLLPVLMVLRIQST